MGGHPYVPALILMRLSWSLPDGGHPYVPALILMRLSWSLPDGGHPYVPALILMRLPWSLPDGGHPYVPALLLRRLSWSSLWRPFEFMGFFSFLPYESYTLTGWTTMEMWSEVSLGFLSSLAFRLALYSQIR